jgi:nitroreductase
MGLKETVKRVLNRLEIFRCYLNDYKESIQHSLTLGINSEDKSKAYLLLVMHGIEKGLSFEKKKPGWGGERASYLTKLIRDHLKKYTKSEVVVVAINVLEAYLSDESSTRDDNIRQDIELLIKEHKEELQPNLGGTMPVTVPDHITDYNEVLQFYSSRKSVRSYSNRDVTDEEIEKAKLIARTTPTACNRQTARIHIIRDREVLSRLLDNQLGDQGWCHKTNVLFIITSNLSYFSGTYERNQALIDGGLYAMNFVMGLHAQKIASCFKMYVRDPRRDKEFKRIAHIPLFEIPVVLVFAGHYNDGESYAPISHRLISQI